LVVLGYAVIVAVVVVVVVVGALALAGGTKTLLVVVAVAVVVETTAVCAARADHHVRDDEHFCTRFEQPLQNRAREGFLGAAVHVAEVNVKANREGLEISERGARVHNPLAHLRSEDCD
jgi:hypothetical protein